VTFVCKYVALHVPDLQEAERFYGEVFGLELLFRESKTVDGSWHTLRPHLDWSDAVSCGISVDMLALGREGFTLALFPGSPTPGTVYELCIGVAPPEIGEIGGRIERNGVAPESGGTWLRFQDPFGFRWFVRSADDPFRSSGAIAERWIG
jgi:catechol 2,3-dioxygenase-like lactoylglutathione lyase family enzyme